MTELTIAKFDAMGEKLYGPDKGDWKFRCQHCDNVQSDKSIMAQFDKGIGSQRARIMKILSHIKESRERRGQHNTNSR